MGTLSVSAAIEKVRLAKPFRISGYVFDDSDLLVVTLREGGHAGRGEASGVYYLGDDAAHMLARNRPPIPCVMVMRAFGIWRTPASPRSCTTASIRFPMPAARPG